MSSRSHKTFYIPPDLKEKFPTLDRACIYRLPTQPRNIVKAVRQPDSSRLYLLGDNGKVYTTSTRLSRWYGFSRMEVTVQDFKEVDVLVRLGEVDAKELELLKTLNREVLEKKKDFHAVESAIESLERRDLPVPDELRELLAECESKLMTWKQWIEASDKAYEDSTKEG